MNIENDLPMRTTYRDLIRLIVLIMGVSSMLGVEKDAADEPSGRRLLAWVVRHPGGACGRGL